MEQERLIEEDEERIDEEQERVADSRYASSHHIVCLKFAVFFFSKKSYNSLNVPLPCGKK